MFSVVIPLYNKESHIEDTIKSVLQQTFFDYEVLVIDDGSTDSSISIVKSFNDSRIKLFKQENAGVSSARNRGVVESKREYIAFLDADDIWHSHYLERMHGLIRQNPGCGLYASGHRQVTMGGIVKREIVLAPGIVNEGRLLIGFFEAIYKFDGFVSASTAVIPREVFFEKNIWFPVGEAYGEDQYVWSLISLRSSLAYMNEALADYIVDSDNNSCSRIESKYEPSKCIFVKEWRHEVANKRERYYLDRFVEKKIIGAINRNILAGYKIHALRQLKYYDISWSGRARAFFKIMLPRYLYVLLLRVINVKGSL